VLRCPLLTQSGHGLDSLTSRRAIPRYDKFRIGVSRRGIKRGVVLVSDIVKRRLVAIFAADMVSYSRLIQVDEVGTIRRQKALRKELIDSTFDRFGGRIVKTTGDGLLVEFASVVDAVQCAGEIQEQMSTRELHLPSETRIRYRVGINLGDIVIDGDDILGDGVNVASRIESLADPGGICISASAYDQVRGKTEYDFQDAGEHLVKNISEPIRVYRLVMRDEASSQAVNIARPERERHRKASIAVLPFENLTDDPQINFLTDGLVEDILTGLQRFRLVSVISRNSTAQFRGSRPSRLKILHELKADYFVEGSIRKAAGFARINVQLIDSHNDEHLWARRFDRPMANPFDLQDEISSAVIAALEPVLIDAEIKRGISPEPGYAHESNLKRAAWHLYRYTKADNEKAIELFERAVAENPNASGRQEALAMGYLWRLTFGWAEEPNHTIAQALAASKKATELVSDDAYKLAVRAWALMWGGGSNLAMAEIARAIELNPQSAMTWVASHIGNADVAITAMQRSLSLSRESPFFFQYASGVALGYFAQQQWSKAAEFAETATLRRPNGLTGWVVMAAANVAQGNSNSAASSYLTLCELCPHMSESWLRSFMPIHSRPLKDAIFSHLRDLGLR